MIKLKINRKQFGSLIIFDNVELNIKSGEMVGIKGLSGSGKTTLLSILGLLDNFEGEYILNDIEITQKNKEETRRNNISYVFQKPYLIPYLNVYDNIIMPLKNLKIKFNKKEIEKLLDKMNILDLLDKYPTYISGGEAQRVNIARAYASRRKIMLVDEPTGSLDPYNAEIVMELLKYLNQHEKITIIMVTHSNEFDEYFDVIYEIKEKGIHRYEKN